MSIPCIALTEKGRACGEPAHIWDQNRGGMVCEKHKPKPAIPIDEQTLQDLVFTLAICRKYLPASADPVHFVRLQRIEGIIQDYFAQYSEGEMKPHG